MKIKRGGGRGGERKKKKKEGKNHMESSNITPGLEALNDT